MDFMEQEMRQKQQEGDHYRRICQQLMADAEAIHKQNLKKIKMGIRCLFWIPLVFLAMIFLTDGEKVIFLVLWIASLFGIAAYLIYIEYTDFVEQERVRKYKNEDGTNENLIGADIEAFEETVEDLLRMIDEKKAENREKMLGMLTRQKPEAAEKDAGDQEGKESDL